MHGEHRAQILHRAVRELVGRIAIVGVVLPVGLGNTHVLLAVLYGIQVGDGSAGRRRRALDVLRAAVHQLADRLPHHVVDAGLSAGTDGDEFLLRLG